MEYRTEYERWLRSSALNDGERTELLMIKEDPQTMAMRFSEPMSFGTAGLRSNM